MKKLTLNKLSMADAIKAATGEFEVDVTDDMLKALGLDEDAMKLGIMTKSSLDDTRIKALEEKVDTLVATLPGIVEAAIKASMPKGEPIDASLLEKVKGFSPADFTAAIVGLKAEVTELAEKTTQAVLTATAVKGEVEQVKTSVASGQATPEMLALMQASQKKDVGVFGRNVALSAAQ